VNPVKAVLLDAAQELETSGWCQGEYMNDAGEHCLVGALQVAAGTDGALLFDAKLAVLRQLEMQVGANASIINFNDEQGRRADEVIALLRETAEAQS